MRKFVGGIVYCAMLKLYQGEKNALNKEIQGHPVKTVIGNFINLVLSNLFKSFKWTDYFEQYH